MQHSAGLDVSIKETSVCIIDDNGSIVRELKVDTHPDELLQVLADGAYSFKRIGGRAAVAVALQCACGSGSSGHLRRGAAHEGDPEGAGQQERPERRPRDRTDDACRHLQVGAREDTSEPEAPDAADQPQAAVVEGDRYRERPTSVLRNFGLKVGVMRAAGFEACIRELIDGQPDRKGRNSRQGDEAVRVLLYEAALVMLTRSAKWNGLKAWAMQVAPTPRVQTSDRRACPSPCGRPPSHVGRWHRVSLDSQGSTGGLGSYSIDQVWTKVF